MKKLISTFVIATVISMPVFAEKGHEHGDSKGPVKDGMMMGHEQMMAMHEHMQKMKEMMAKIKAETDPEKRQQLMQEHRRTMQGGMKMLDESMGMGMGKGMDMTKAGSSKMGNMDMKKRMDMMEERMGMMQMMMGQMMEHESEFKKAPVHKDKK
jgi:hypothetical protein